MEVWSQPWLALAGAMVPLIGLYWRFSADRGAKTAQEIVHIEQAIASAQERKDAIQYAYRAVAFERLQRAHQKDRSRSGFGLFMLWGFYAAMLWIVVLATAVPGTTEGAVLVTGAGLASFLALHGWARWARGAMNLEPDANHAYRQAMADARRDFLKHAESLPELSPAPSFIRLCKATVRAIPSGKRKMALRMVWSMAPAIPLAVLLYQAMLLGWFDFELGAKVAFAIFFASAYWVMRPDHRRLLFIFPVTPTKSTQPYFLAILGMMTATLTVATWYLFTTWTFRVSRYDSHDPTSTWGWPLAFATCLVASAHFLIVGKPKTSTQEPAAPQQA